jgi:hypothetical protein
VDGWLPTVTDSGGHVLALHLGNRQPARYDVVSSGFFVMRKAACRCWELVGTACNQPLWRSAPIRNHVPITLATATSPRSSTKWSFNWRVYFWHLMPSTPVDPFVKPH